MTQSTSPEKGAQNLQTREALPVLVVSQPKKLEGLLETIALLDRISERVGEDRSGDMGGAGAAATGQKGTTAATSKRDQRIANLPPAAIMRRELKKQIEKEVKGVQKDIHAATRQVSRPGAAYRLNVLYARLRRLNALISDLLEAAYDVIKRLFIKVVIDEQKVL